MNPVKKNISVNRLVGLTDCPDGLNDLCPITITPCVNWWQVYEDFYCQSFSPYPAVSYDCPAWSAAYRTKDDQGIEREFSDLMVFDLNGWSVDHALRWLVGNNLAGLIHATRSNTPANPCSRIILVLHRPVNSRTYQLLWNRLAQEVFESLANPAHADFRQRCEQPRAVRNQTTLLHHDGNLLNVESVLAEPCLAGDALSLACQAYANESWPRSMPPRNC